VPKIKKDLKVEMWKTLISFLIAKHYFSSKNWLGKIAKTLFKKS